MATAPDGVHAPSRQALFRQIGRSSRALLRRLGETRIRLPTALWVSLLGALLSVWILPAITRQWDDRQKARELKAALAQEVEAASARSLSVGWSLDSGWELSEAVAAERSWFTSQLTIDAKLRAQFPEDMELLRLWHRYRPMVAAYGAVITEVSSPLDRSLSREHALEVRREWISTQLRKIVPKKRAAYLLDEFVPETLFTGDRISELRYQHLSRWAGADNLRNEVLAREQPFIQRLLAAHPAGFSTTRGDLLRDLFP